MKSKKGQMGQTFWLIAGAIMVMIALAVGIGMYGLSKGAVSSLPGPVVYPRSTFYGVSMRCHDTNFTCDSDNGVVCKLVDEDVKKIADAEVNKVIENGETARIKVTISSDFHKNGDYLGKLTYVPFAKDSKILDRNKVSIERGENDVQYQLSPTTQTLYFEVTGADRILGTPCGGASYITFKTSSIDESYDCHLGFPVEVIGNRPDFRIEYVDYNNTRTWHDDRVQTTHMGTQAVGWRWRNEPSSSEVEYCPFTTELKITAKKGGTTKELETIELEGPPPNIDFPAPYNRGDGSINLVKYFDEQNLASGTWTITLEIDPDDKIVEEDEGNNKMSVVVNVDRPPHAELVPQVDECEEDSDCPCNKQTYTIPMTGQVATLKYQQVCDPDSSCTIDGSESYDPEKGPLTYTWQLWKLKQRSNTFVDDYMVKTVTGTSNKHTFLSSEIGGSNGDAYRVKLRVYDNKGVASDEDHIDILISDNKHRPSIVQWKDYTCIDGQDCIHRGIVWDKDGDTITAQMNYRPVTGSYSAYNWKDCTVSKGSHTEVGKYDVHCTFLRGLGEWMVALKVKDGHDYIYFCNKEAFLNVTTS